MSAFISLLLLILVVLYTMFYSIDFLFNRVFADFPLRDLIAANNLWTTVGAGAAAILSFAISFSAIFAGRSKTRVFGSKKTLVAIASISFALILVYGYKLYRIVS